MFKDMSTSKLSELVNYKSATVMINLFHDILPIRLQKNSSDIPHVEITNL